MATEGEMTGEEQVRRLYEESENRTAKAFEELVARDSFGELLARMTENVVALTRIGTDVFDLVLRNLRLAGRQDVTRLARQLARAEDKLELVLQELERLHDRLHETERPSRTDGNRRTDGELHETPAPGMGVEGS
jgi:hypothetical protein